MKKIFLTVALASIVCVSASAGGTKANTNQSVQWVRHLARGTSLDPDAVYYNPAGTVFMTDGFHLSVGDQMVFQNRRATIDYAPFAGFGGSSTKTYDGKTFAPVLPNVDFVYKHSRFAAMLSLGVGGGGGTATYDNGLGVFEQQISVLPPSVSALGAQYGLSASKYSFDTSLKGTQITYAVNVGVAYRITEWLSFAAQARIDYVGNGYEGSIGNIMFDPKAAALGLDGSMVPAYATFQKIGGAMAGTPIGATASALAAKVADKELNVKQNGWGISPVLSLYFNKDSWSAAARYEFRTNIDIKNSTKVDNIGLFADGAKSAYDQPALLSLALSKRFCDRVSVTAEWHYYWDKQANIGNVFGASTPLTDCIKRNTMEYIAGVEWTVSPRWLVSLGAQYTDYSLDESYHTELGYQSDCTTVGLGGAYKISNKVKLNFAASRAFFTPITTTVNRPIAEGAPALDYTSKYTRKSTIVSVGFDFAF